MSWPVPSSDDHSTRLPSLAALGGYLRGSGWVLVDEDSRTSMWRPETAPADDLFVVLPARENFKDYGERVYEALRAVAYIERRMIDEIAADINYGAADTVAVRLMPDTPSGEAPLSLAYSAMSALRSYVIGSGSALDNDALVLPTRRPLQAESYVNRVRFATHAGSFILTLALPLVEAFNEVSPPPENPAEPDAIEPVQEPMFQLSVQPFGRRVTNRMAVVAKNAQLLADVVNAGDQGIRAFGQVGRDVPTPLS